MNYVNDLLIIGLLKETLASLGISVLWYDPYKELFNLCFHFRSKEATVDFCQTSRVLFSQFGSACCSGMDASLCRNHLM